MMTYILIGLGIVIAVLVFIITNLYNQVITLEKKVKESIEMENRAVRLHEVMLGIFTRAASEMKRVDKNGAFSSDDEVGFAFRTIFEAIEQVKTHLKILKGIQEQESNSNKGQNNNQ